MDLLVAEIDRLNRLLMEHITENEDLNSRIEDLSRFNNYILDMYRNLKKKKMK